MKEEFLRQVARHYFASVESLCFVFPNKRAAVFFKKYLGQEVAASGHAKQAPGCFTMNDFFYHISGAHKAGRIKQLLVLYDCYKKLNSKAEPIDEFLYWGEMMLSDFGDVDKYLADPSKLWKNASELKAMQDLSFLSEEQQEAIKRFLGNFDGKGAIKESFLHIWNLLLPLYNAFGEALKKQNLSYEGQIYRALAEELKRKSVVDMLEGKFGGAEKFVFVGLNALNECEKTLLGKMKNAGIAEFCWDFSSEEIRDPENKASFFMRDNLTLFGQAFPIDGQGLAKPKIKIVGIPSGIGQAKLLPEILKAPGAKHDLRTAVVLPDEGLLTSVLSSIPPEIDEINVTMGYPMKGSQWLGLFKEIGALQSNMREGASGKEFYHKQVWAIFSNSVFRASLSEEEKSMVEQVRGEAKFFIAQSDLAEGEFLEALFREAAPSKISYLKNLIHTISRRIKDRQDMAMELEFAMHTYKALTNLEDLPSDIQDRTWWKLLLQLLAAEAVPFRGEPLRGMQIMGPLETRALDFEKLIILSCNEGVFPRRAVASSFIPAELRKAFGLPTYEYQDAISAYYFYRAIQRAEEVTLIYDSRSGGLQSGEESRYIKQIRYLYEFDIEQVEVKTPLEGIPEADSITKTEEDIAIVKSPDFYLSASSVKEYLTCPAKFYYSKIKGLKEAEEVEENMDGGMIGTVLHLLMQSLYSRNPDEPDKERLAPLESVGREYLKTLLAGEDLLRARVAYRIRQQLKNSPEVRGRNLIYAEMIFRYARQILRRDLELLTESGAEAFKIIGLEKFFRGKLCGYNFTAYIDRLDSFLAGTLRISDYKTGKIYSDEDAVNAENASGFMDAVRAWEKGKRPEIALQLFVYDSLAKDFAGNKKLLNSIYGTQRLHIQKLSVNEVCEDFGKEVEAYLSERLQELADKEVNWIRSGTDKDCEWCKFKKICGR